MKITLVGNAGIYMRDKQHSILIDGLYGGNEFFNQRPSEVCEAAVGRGHVFRNIKNLLVTHRHEDHFSSYYVNSYIQSNEVVHAYIPRISRSPLKYEDTGIVMAEGTDTRIHCVGSKDELIFYDELAGGGWAVFFKTPHMGGAAFAVIHYSIALLLHGKSYLFMGDTDWSYSVRNVRSLLQGTQLKGIFVNPLAYADRRRKEWLAGLGCCPRVLLYHIPFADDDVSGIRSLADSETSFYTLKDGYVLKENRQTVFVN